MRMKTLRLRAGSVLVVITMASCGGHSPGESPLPFAAPTPPPSTASNGSAIGTEASAGTSPPSSALNLVAPIGPTLAQQIGELERRGGYPVLDRSSEVTGPDANANGVRDDIEAWVNTLDVTEPQRRALMQRARSLQQTLLVDLDDKQALQRAGEGLSASTKCSGDRFEPQRAQSYAISRKIEAMTANTRQRAARYMQYNKARSGSSTRYPDGDTCDP